MKESRRREAPPYETQDGIITNTTEIEKDLLLQIDPDHALIVVDKPAEGYMEKIRYEAVRVYREAGSVEEKKEERCPVFCTLAEFKKEKDLCGGILSSIKDVVFVNVRKSEDKKHLIEKMKGCPQRYFFLSNAYKIEKVHALEKVGVKRVLPKKEGFGLLRSTKSFGRTHEVIFAGEPHLKQNACVIALEQNITVPCVIAVERESEIEKVAETVERVKALAGKATQSLPEYLQKKKWVYITTHAALLKSISTPDFEPLRSITDSLLSYDTTDKSVYLLSMHQVSLHVFSLSTTQDRGKVRKILETLPKYGINLGEKAEATLQQIPRPPLR